MEWALKGSSRSRARARPSAPGFDASDETEAPSAGSAGPEGPSPAALLECDDWRERGCALAEEGRFEEALSLWQKALAVVPGDHRLHELKAQAFLALDRVAQALVSAQHAVDLVPDWVDGLQTLGRCQREMGEVITSLQTYETAHAADPRNAELMAEMAEVRALVDQLEARRQMYLEQLRRASSEDEAEVCRCLYNLSSRAQPPGHQ